MNATAEPTVLASRRRRAAVWALVVLAALVILFASLTVWVRRQALDTDAWTKASASLLEDDEIRGAIAVFVVDELYANVDVEAELEGPLPPRVEPLAGPIAAALREPAERRVDRFLERPRVQDAWETANRRAHQALLAVIEGQPRPNVSTAEGAVTLDLRSFVVDTGAEFGIGERLDERLPADVGQVTILRSEQLETAQRGVEAIRAVSWLFGILALALWAAALWIAHGWRRVVVMRIGTSLVLVGLLLLVVRRVGRNYLVDALTTPGPTAEAAGNAWLLATTLLADIGWAAIVYGLALVAGAWLAGPRTHAAAARARVAPTLADKPGLVWAAAGAVFLLLVLWGPTPAFRSLVGVVLLAALSALGLEALRRVILAEQAPPRAPEPTT